MTSIDQFVTDYLRGNGLGQYTAQVRPVIDGLIEREQNLARSIIDAAADNGMERDTAVTFLTEIGMHVPGLVAAATFTGEAPTGTFAMPENPGTVESAMNAIDETGDDLEARVARLERIVTDLIQFARANGYRA